MMPVVDEPQAAPPDPEPTPDHGADGEPETTTTTTRRRWVLPMTLALVASLLGGSVVAWYVSRDATVAPNEVQAAIEEAFSSTTVEPDRGPAIFNTIIPSVVFVQVGGDRSDGGSIGTGVVINADGSIMTSNHVVDTGEPINVTFADGTLSVARVVQSNPEMDIAILSASTLPAVLVPAVLGGSVPIGAKVYAVGNPLGLGGSFSAGVVSGLDRSLPLDDDLSLFDLIQFDAAVNPGSSGGPLVDENAQVVGIVTALANPTGEDFFSGIGFAVPIATAGGAAGGPEQ
ncbi:MAG: S1-C subfamily serine protease [Verrucomicrobiales bacterium]|jgi:S1-C subfamily serine protease